MNEEEVFQFVQVCNQQVKEFSALRNSLQNHFQLRRVLFESCFNAKLFDIEALIENLKDTLDKTNEHLLSLKRMFDEIKSLICILSDSENNYGSLKNNNNNIVEEDSILNLLDPNLLTLISKEKLLTQKNNHSWNYNHYSNAASKISESKHEWELEIEEYEKSIKIQEEIIFLFSHSEEVILSIIFFAFPELQTRREVFTSTWNFLVSLNGILKALKEYIISETDRKLKFLSTDEKSYLEKKFNSILVFASQLKSSSHLLLEEDEYKKQDIKLFIQFIKNNLQIQFPSLVSTNLVKTERNSFSEFLQVFFELIPVQGDGNCFFRAVIRSYFPKLSLAYENKLQYRLRKVLNGGSTDSLLSRFGDLKKQDLNQDTFDYSEFSIEEDVKYNMLKDGVWADHIQIQKLTQFLNSSIWIYRFDDNLLSFQFESVIPFQPGESYKLGEYDSETPILLHYLPSPGHYEALILQKNNLLSIIEELTMLEDFVNNYNFKPITTSSTTNNNNMENGHSSDEPNQNFLITPYFICKLWFRISDEVSEISQTAKNVAYTYSSRDKKGLEADLQIRATECRDWIQNFQKHIIKLHKVHNYFQNFYTSIEHINAHRFEVLIEDILWDLLHDNLVLNIEPNSNSCTIQIGQGPLSETYQLIHRLLPRTSLMSSGLIVPKYIPFAPSSYSQPPSFSFGNEEENTPPFVTLNPIENLNRFEKLLTREHTPLQQWIEALQSLEEISFAQCRPTVSSLRSLIDALKNSSISNLIFDKCVLGEACCSLLCEARHNFKINIKSSELGISRLDLERANSNIFASNCKNIY